MSWLLENWFGSKESLDQVREDIHENLHKEIYLGVSGIENPEQSANRLPSKELFVSLHGPWDVLEEQEAELLRYIHDELPPVVRDEVGIFPFYTQVTQDGYLVLTYIRNATEKSVLLDTVPLNLVTPEGEVVARKNFEMMTFGPIGDQSSRPCEFLFRWDEFDNLPEKEIPLTLGYVRPVKKSGESAQAGGELEMDEIEYYRKKLAENPVQEGQVDLKALGLKEGENGGLKVVVLFRNGLDKRLEFTEVPIIVHDQSGEAIARVSYTLENMKVDAKDFRIIAFEIPASSILKEGVSVEECTVFIPKATQQKTENPVFDATKSKGFLQ
ncbi:SLAP domain-containing protein [Brevibacillus composti]|uniref:SLAP domain-containing protein n=1 Tax=Brevibacillus composti TaxID=2796470 RepID=A0A7T5EK79_9BACL|nr:SLAP domain-containing protein [Brevibacillus composti]QQE74126.1 SLAP domain-containing protein [Brevibacillus composti]QUO41210.1 SLAP domain-containing protein [Brevibacillus composti]